MTALRHNPIYVLYSRFNGFDPEAMLAHDTVRWPGGKMCGFLLWNQVMLRRFLRAHDAPDLRVVPGNYAAYEHWLEEEVSVTLSG